MNLFANAKKTWNFIQISEICFNLKNCHGIKNNFKLVSNEYYKTKNARFQKKILC